MVTLPTAGGPLDLDITKDDVVLLAMKTHDSAVALDNLAAVAPPTTSVVCLQNGVENERLALRHFANVYATVVACPTAHLKPGVVAAFSTPVTGMLDIGRYPSGVDERCDMIAQAFTAGTLPSISRPDIMRWKYRKLDPQPGERRGGRVRTGGPRRRTAPTPAASEGEAVLDAAGIDRVSSADDLDRRAGLLSLLPIGGEPRPGASMWQSLQTPLRFDRSRLPQR